MLTISNLTLRYKNSNQNILVEVSLEINKGEIIAIMGPSGCGKTTLLNYLQRANKDIIKVSGEIDLSKFRTIRTVFQESRLLPWLTVENNITFGLISNGTLEEVALKKVNKYIKMVGLEKYSQMLPKELSIGMQQRVNFARALACKPDLLFLDEPFSALDIVTKETLQQEFIKIIKKEKVTALFVTHSIDEAMKLADKVVVLSSCPAKVESIISRSENNNKKASQKMEFDPFAG